MKTLSRIQKKFVKRIIDLDAAKSPIYLSTVMECVLPQGMFIGMPYEESQGTIAIYYLSSEYDSVLGRHTSELLEIVELAYWLEKFSYIVVEQPNQKYISIGEKVVDAKKGWVNIGNDLIAMGLWSFFSGQKIFITEDLRQFKRDRFKVKEEKYLSWNRSISIGALLLSLLAFLFSIIAYL